LFYFSFINLFTIYFMMQSAALATWRRMTRRLEGNESTGMQTEAAMAYPGYLPGGLRTAWKAGPWIKFKPKISKYEA
jgi:hypothetical protein